MPYKEINVLLNDIIEDVEGCAAELAEETKSKKAAEENENREAEEMRKTAMGNIC